jgi:hypothetical protein
VTTIQDQNKLRPLDHDEGAVIKILSHDCMFQHGGERLRKAKRFVPGSLVGIKDIDFVGRSEAETP